MHSYIFEMNFPVDFVLNKTMTGEEKKLITREKHPGRIAQVHKLAALMKKRKEQILRNKEQSTVQPTVQSTVHANILMPMVLVCLKPLVVVYFLHITPFSLKNSSSMKKKINHQNDVICFKKCTING